ncbi:hypothetical protein XENTR_v10008199, partial [Xenopus tropicalis]
QLKMFRHIAIHFLLIHCFTAFVFVQSAIQFSTPQKMITEILCFIKELENHPKDLPSDFFETPTNVTNDKCLTSNMNVFKNATHSFHFKNSNERMWRDRIYTNLKCIQDICPRLNNTNEHGVCKERKSHITNLLKHLKLYLGHVYSEDICPSALSKDIKCHTGLQDYRTECPHL